MKNEYEEEDLTLAPMSRRELAQLGDGEVAYIKQLDPEVAEKLFPALRRTPEGHRPFRRARRRRHASRAHRQPQRGDRQRHRERPRAGERALTAHLSGALTFPLIAPPLGGQGPPLDPAKGGRTSGHVHPYRSARGGAHRHNKLDFGAALAMGEFANGLLEQFAPR